MLDACQLGFTARRGFQLPHSIDGYDIVWDAGHGDIKGGYAKLAQACDQGIGTLL